MTAFSLLAQEGSSGGGSIQLLILLLIPFAMYFLLIRPQRKRMKDTAAMQSSLGVGDEIITTSGIYGFITGEEDDRFWIEIDDDVQIRVAKAAIQGKTDTSGDSDDDADTDEDADDTEADTDDREADTDAADDATSDDASDDASDKDADTDEADAES